MRARIGRSFRRLAMAGGALLAMAAGCGVDFAYLAPAVVGQLDLLQQAVPVADALASGTLTDEQVAKLELIQDVRLFAQDVIGLNAADNYTMFYDSHGEPVAYNVSASRKDAFAPMIWNFPIVGNVPYLGYFELASAERKRRELAARDLDVFIYPVDAYSGLGFYPNPILSPMLERDDIGLVDTVVHELLHNTVWRENDTPFNESLATFFGRTGALAYFAARHPTEPDRIQQAVDTFADSDRYNAFALELFNELDAYYAAGRSSAEKVAGRAALFEAGRSRFVTEVLPLMNDPDSYRWVEEFGFPVNNAWMLGIRRYNLDLAVFQQVFDAVGGDWSAALELFHRAAASSDPYAFLRAWSGESPPG